MCCPLFVLNKKCQNRGNNTAQADGDAAHGPLQRADFHGLSGTQRMAAGADGQALRHRIFDLEPFAEERCQHRTGQTGDHHAACGDARHTAVALGNTDGNGGGITCSVNGRTER